MMLDSKQLHALADKFNLPKRQLSEAQEVLLSHGLSPFDIKKEIISLCESANAQGGGVAMFHKLLLGQIAILKASKSF